MTISPTPSTTYIAPTTGIAPVAGSHRGVEARLANNFRKYPNLENDLSKARADVESTRDSHKWSGLKWYEKAVFFILPFGPILGVSLMAQNKEMHANAVNTLNKLTAVANERSGLLNILNGNA